MDVLEIMRNPLVQEGRSGPFLRLVLAEAVRYGMPPQAIATLDDVAAMLGFYDPLPAGAAAQLAGPLGVWRTHPDQPIIERIAEVEGLAYKQRCLVAFGGARPDHMVGTAEIVCAMGNLHKESGIPKPYREIFEWATVDVLSMLTGDTPEEVRKAKKYPYVSDDEVLKPGGRLHSTYQEIATSLRRTVIAAMENAPDNPREYLRPLAAHFVRSHHRHLAEAEGHGDTELVDKIRDTIATIEGMFPDLNLDPQVYIKAEGAEAE